MKKVTILEAKICLVGEEDWMSSLKTFQNGKVQVLKARNMSEELFPDDTPNSVIFETINQR